MQMCISFYNKVTTRPTLEKFWGTAMDFQLVHLLNAANTGHLWLISKMKSGSERRGCSKPRCPSRRGSTPLASQEEIFHLISHFINHLKAWVDLDTGLENIKHKAPQVYAECKRLMLEFETRLSLTFRADLEPSKHRSEFHPDLIEAWDVLNSLHEWRRALAKHDLTEAIQTLSQQPHQEWQIVHYALKETLHWQDDILPILHRIQSFKALRITRSRHPA